ncbi:MULTISPECIES: PTS sugar transporter subunit IIA [Aerococcus]|uniref:PTS sugar transporter subunit IIA n=1 Tax=Aerococcus sanguinicola TaxID=119206 RepID=A0A5N1GP07_9LACT|nr:MULTISPECIES: PTS sugar transporter subunit IIA [Aerococcus]KAA9301771.1 PTS sugar transporter subunit IIA [Aerococcus sanguinicola]MDK6368812.1 PTS sugar transporter subunit IIA [Aerococcus sp. UMB9870]MDK6679411.1 PTS sugar transporter subunit IIA [Aerococcus sp. UMB8608]MDK6685745.1 PTS sugar transporter subunit IIA [Aerococcus sp. UMB8623]MDK6939436.1 PTS sugar transporter subunit IIA [Aerococcus sp. UMB8487]
MKLLLATHGNFAEGILQSYEMIAGDSTGISTVILNDLGIDDFRNRLHQTLDELLATDEVLVLVDLPGGTPYNESLAYQFEHGQGLGVIAGLNLPMLIEVGMGLPSLSLEDLKATALEFGQNGIQSTDDLLAD